MEPNSGLGKAISYMLRQWPALTLFLREPGAPLDNNLCERALKKAILHRKNSLFYKTLNGAEVGDLYMSLIHTCELKSEAQISLGIPWSSGSDHNAAIHGNHGTVNEARLV